MEKTFNIIISPSATTDEVTDTIADLFAIGITVENALEDGFQLDDFLVAIQLQPTVMEVINDFPVFISQFTQLNGATAIAAVQAAKERTMSDYGEIGKVGTFIYGALMQMASTFNFIESTAIAGIKEIDGWKDLFATIKQPETTKLAA